MKTLHILHIEDDPVQAELIRRVLDKSGLDSRITLALTCEQYLSALAVGDVDVVLCDSSGYGFNGLDALHHVHRHHPDLPFLFLCGSYENRDTRALEAEGAVACLTKDELDDLAPAIRKAVQQD